MTANQPAAIPAGKALNVKSGDQVVGRLQATGDGRWQASLPDGTSLGTFPDQKAAQQAIATRRAADRKAAAIKSGAKEDARAHRSASRLPETRSTEKLTGSAARIDRAVRSGTVKRK